MKYSHKIIYVIVAFLPISGFASTTNGTIIDQYAWSENAGWVNFLTTNGNVQVTDSAITGYVWDANYGWMNLNPTNGGVLNDGEGNLSGHAWSTGAGWIDFENVSINSSGKFTGTAEGDVYGTLTFNCDNCNVTTDWRSVTVRDSIESENESSSSRGGTFIRKVLPITEVTNQVTESPKTKSVTDTLNNYTYNETETNNYDEVKNSSTTTKKKLRTHTIAENTETYGIFTDTFTEVRKFIFKIAPILGVSISLLVFWILFMRRRK